VTAGGEAGGAWFVVAGAALAAVTAFWLRTWVPASVVAALLAAGGAAIGWGGMLLQSEPPISQVVFVVVTLAVLVPFHIRVVFGPFGPQRRSMDEGRGR
jgi:hypothetical protein